MKILCDLCFVCKLQEPGLEFMKGLANFHLQGLVFESCVPDTVGITVDLREVLNHFAGSLKGSECIWLAVRVKVLLCIPFSVIVDVENFGLFCLKVIVIDTKFCVNSDFPVLKFEEAPIR